MRSYRLFILNKLRRVEEEHAFKAASDEEAKQIACERRELPPAELWNTYRRLARWD